MSNEDYESVEHPRLELHLHVATKFVQVTIMMMMMMRMLICRYDFGGDDALDGGCDLFHDDITAEILKGLFDTHHDALLSHCQLGSLVGLTLVGPLVGAWRGRSLGAAGENGVHMIKLVSLNFRRRWKNSVFYKLRQL